MKLLAVLLASLGCVSGFQLALHRPAGGRTVPDRKSVV